MATEQVGRRDGIHSIDAVLINFTRGGVVKSAGSEALVNLAARSDAAADDWRGPITGAAVRPGLWPVVYLLIYTVGTENLVLTDILGQHALRWSLEGSRVLPLFYISFCPFSLFRESGM